MHVKNYPMHRHKVVQNVLARQNYVKIPQRAPGDLQLIEPQDSYL